MTPRRWGYPAGRPGADRRPGHHRHRLLGAGVILRYKDTIRGLTTAACVWVACAVGLAIGAGFYLFGSAVTGLTLVSLVGLKTFDDG